MRSTTRIAAVSGAVLAATAGIAGPASAHSSGAVFVQTDEATGNRVIAYDGNLHQTGSYSTGGKGGTLDGAVADDLASQGSLTLDRAHHLLYAVNAGTSTVTVFRVNGTRLTRLQVVGSGGDFPVSVTVHGNLVYVLNARDGGSIQGFRRVGALLVRESSWHRKLGLDPNLTPEFQHSTGQITFSPSGRQLLVTTEANTNAIDVFAVAANGTPSSAPVQNVEKDAVPFAGVFDRFGHLLVTEAGPSALASYRLDHSGKVTSLSTVATGGMATCWVVGANGTFYTSNAGTSTVTAFRADRDGTLTRLGTTPTNKGTIDAAASRDGSTLYVQTGVAGTVDKFHVHGDGSLTAAGSVVVPGGAGGEGIAAG